MKSTNNIFLPLITVCILYLYVYCIMSDSEAGHKGGDFIEKACQKIVYCMFMILSSIVNIVISLLVNDRLSEWSSIIGTLAFPFIIFIFNVIFGKLYLEEKINEGDKLRTIALSNLILAVRGVAMAIQNSSNIYLNVTDIAISDFIGIFIAVDPFFKKQDNERIKMVFCRKCSRSNERSQTAFENDDRI